MSRASEAKRSHLAHKRNVEALNGWNLEDHEARLTSTQSAQAWLAQLSGANASIGTAIEQAVTAVQALPEGRYPDQEPSVRKLVERLAEDATQQNLANTKVAAEDHLYSALKEMAAQAAGSKQAR